jgi:hypothetical protein
MIGSKNVKVDEYKSLGIGFGILKLKVMDYALLESTKTGKKRLEFFVEDDNPVGEGGYEYEGALGKHVAANKQGRVGVSIYFDTVNDVAKINEVVRDLTVIADKIGKRAELDAVEENTIEAYLFKAVKIIQGNYVYFVVKAEERLNADGKKIVIRTLKSWGKGDSSVIIVKPVEGSELTVEGNVHTLVTDKKTITWDKSKSYDFKLLDKPDAEPAEDTGKYTSLANDDLPF